MSKCPTCSTDGCYNSGFSIECVSEECLHFSEKQAALFEQERKTDPPSPEEDHGECAIAAPLDHDDLQGLDDDDIHYVKTTSSAVSGRMAAARIRERLDFEQNKPRSSGMPNPCAEIPLEATGTASLQDAYDGGSDIIPCTPLSSSKGCVACDLGIPTKKATYFSSHEAYDEYLIEKLSKALGVPPEFLSVQSKAVTGGLPDWLWEVCSGGARILDKDPGDLTLEEVRELLSG